MRCVPSFISIVLASVITAIATALLATVIFVLVQIAVCKCQLRPEPQVQEYEEVDGGVAVSDPTYMEVRGGEKGGNIFPLKKNKAYASTTSK